MAPHPKVKKAFAAMKTLGIPEKTVKPVLKELLRLYEKNWELIEAENFRALADAIFGGEDDSTQDTKKKKRNTEDDPREEEEEDEEEEEEEDESVRPLKRLRRGREVNQSLNMDESLVSRAEDVQVSPESSMKRKGKEPMFPQPEVPLSSDGVSFKEPAESGCALFPKDKVLEMLQVIKPKDEPFGDDIEVAVSTTYPDHSVSNKHVLILENGETKNRNDTMSEEDIQKEPSLKLDIASSPLGEVKLSLSRYMAVGEPKFHMPTLEAVIKLTEQKCLSSYKITDPNFSVTELLGSVCESFLELGTDSVEKSQDKDSCNGTVSNSQTRDALKTPESMDALEGSNGNLGIRIETSHEQVGSEFDVTEKNLSQVDQSQLSSNGTMRNSPTHDALEKPASMDVTEGNLCARFETANELSEKDPSETLNERFESGLDGTAEKNYLELGFPVVGEKNLSNVHADENKNEEPSNDIRPFHDASDITKGEEKVEVPWINEVNNKTPPFFLYIPQSIVFLNAETEISLSKIGDLNSCPTCFGDCLSAYSPCVCARETGGQFAYTPAGSIKESFLEDCISLTRDPQKQCQIICEECPLEKSKGDDTMEACKGHSKRKFIKECWSKCGCNKRCGNRVVQRGITRKLQVFLASEEKGWALRTLEDLPKGAFVCEYVGEIMTASELFEKHHMKGVKNKNDTFIVLLDAEWGPKASPEPKKALALDASDYGNVARFINHRCVDANLVEIPVEVETPAHHYYHLAFFTTRKVAAMEELTWDYGIDFDDEYHPVKSFACNCGSRFCRNIKRPTRS